VTDIVDKQTRSRMMSGIKSSNTKPEIITRRALHKLGYRFRLKSKIDKIKPDIVLSKHKVAIFTHGCYWHKHDGCKLAYANRKYSDKWKKKFDENKRRDIRVLGDLEEKGWRIAIIWECVTRNRIEFQKTLNQLNNFILSGKSGVFESSYKAS
jgi:DNA mismatch endonuclease, patch repair protein